MNIKTMMEEITQEELERDGAACREVMQSRKKNAGGDLISRSALIAEYDRVHVGAPGGARTLMVEAPTVDAVPVVHGRWDKNWNGDNIVYCDRCYMPQDVPTPYCHNCGAKMDGDADG